MDRKNQSGLIVIECPHTVFQLFIQNDTEVSKIEIFMRNIKKLKNFGTADIYNWCERQGIAYETHFNFKKNASPSKLIKNYVQYYKQKHRAKLAFGTV